MMRMMLAKIYKKSRSIRDFLCGEIEKLNELIQFGLGGQVIHDDYDHDRVL